MTRLSLRVLSRKALFGVAVAVTALVLGSGCGGGGGGGNDNESPAPTSTVTPTATPTATPTTTPVPQPTATQVGPTTATITLDLTATATLQGLDVRLAYPTSAGSFSGSGEGVACTTDSGGTFVKNDPNDGNLTLILASPTALVFPVHVACTFDVTAGHSLAADDLVPTVREVTANGAVGDPTTLRVRVTSSPAR